MAEKMHHLRLRSRGRCPTGAKAILTSVPSNWRDQPDPFSQPRRFSNGTLPSFNRLGAVGKGAFGGLVIYPHSAYRRYFDDKGHVIRQNLDIILHNETPGRNAQ